LRADPFTLGKCGVRARRTFAGIFLLVAVAASSGCRMLSQNQNCNGVAHFQHGQYQQAVAQFQQAVQTDPTNADSYYNLAAAYHLQAKQTNDRATYEAAERLYNQCLDVNGNHPDCYRALAVLLVETNRQDKAEMLLKNWAIQSPNLSTPRVELARLSEELGNKQQAQAWLNDALAINSADPRALAAMGKLREQQGDTVAAYDNYRRAYAAAPNAAVADRLANLSRTAAPAATTATAPAAAAATPRSISVPSGTRLVTPQPAKSRY
jgi:tetratricopeptide (TPR) repeat protein